MREKQWNDMREILGFKTHRYDRHSRIKGREIQRISTFYRHVIHQQVPHFPRRHVRSSVRKLGDLV